MQQQVICTPQPDIDAYHAMPAVGSSGLKEFIRRTPAHYFDRYRAEDRERVDKKAFRIGRAWHCAVFEPEHFAARYVTDHAVSKQATRAKVLAELLALDAVQAQAELNKCVGIPDDIKATTKAGKELYAEHEAKGLRPMPLSELEWIGAELSRMHGKDVLSEDNIATVLKMARIARDLPTSRVLFGPLREYVMIEQTITVTHPETGLLLKIRPDLAVRPCEAFPNGLVVDGKSTMDASRRGFGRQVWNNDYGLQAEFYTRVLQQHWGTPERAPFAWLAQEKERPHPGKYWFATHMLLEYWQAKIDRALVQFAECEATGIWPAYGDDPEDVELPIHAETAIESYGAILVREVLYGDDEVAA